MTLHDFLRQEHGYSAGSADSKPFVLRIDDKQNDDLSDGFCYITVTVPGRDRDVFSLDLSNIPWNEDVVALATELNGEWSETPSGRCLTLEMDAKSAPRIRKLAEAIRKVTGRGRRYDNCNWKWITRRTATSLKRLADHLREYSRCCFAIG